MSLLLNQLTKIIIVLILIGVLSYLCGLDILTFLFFSFSFYLFTGIYLASTIPSPTEYSIYPPQEKSKIPNVIYTYWHALPLPATVEACIRSWRKLHPDYEIHLITKDTINKYAPPVSSLRHATTHQRTADFLRMYLMATHGGFWLDASVYLNKRLDWVHAYQEAESSEYVGYKLKLFQSSTIPVIENWFMAAIPNSTFVNTWKDAFFKMNDYKKVDDYVSDIRRVTSTQNIPEEFISYLTMHLACLSILPMKSKLSLLVAENGPFLYLHQCGWNSIYLPIMFLWHQGKEAPLIKYRGGERSFLEKSQFHILLG